MQAVAGPAAVDHMHRLDGIVRSVASQLKAKPDDVPARVAGAATSIAHIHTCDDTCRAPRR